MCTFAKMTPVACLPRRWWVSSWRRWIRSVFSQGGDIERCFSISIIRTWTSDFFILICLVTVSYWTQQLNQEKNHKKQTHLRHQNFKCFTKLSLKSGHPHKGGLPMGSAESARATGGPRRFCRMPVPKSNTLILDGPGMLILAQY